MRLNLDLIIIIYLGRNIGLDTEELSWIQVKLRTIASSNLRDIGETNIPVSMVTIIPSA